MQVSTLCATRWFADRCCRACTRPSTRAETLRHTRVRGSLQAHSLRAVWEERWPGLPLILSILLRYGEAYARQCSSHSDVYCQTTIQGQDPKPPLKFKSVMDAFRHIHRTEGWKGFTRGFTACITRGFPVNAATFFVYGKLGWGVEPSGEGVQINALLPQNSS